MNGYAPVDAKMRKMLTSADISRIFLHDDDWFDRARVRRALYAKGFPHPVVAGLWSPYAVRRWQMTVGDNPEAVPPKIARHDGKPKRQPRPRARNGYASL